MGGATARQLLQRMPQTPDNIAEEDVTFVFCMLNEVSGDKITAFSETRTVGQDIIDLCHHMLKFNRPMLVVGGTSGIWSYNTVAWDVMVNKMVLMARAMGIPTITGERYLRLLTLGPDKTHAEESESNADVYLQWFQDMRNAAYAIVPEGSIRNPTARRAIADQAVAAAQTKAGQPKAVPAKAGQSAGSSSDLRGVSVPISAAQPTTPPAWTTAVVSPTLLSADPWLEPDSPPFPTQVPVGLLAKAGIPQGVPAHFIPSKS